jgi:hypothetical protein
LKYSRVEHKNQGSEKKDTEEEKWWSKQNQRVIMYMRHRYTEEMLK